MRILLIHSKPFLPVIDGGTAASSALVDSLLEQGHDLTFAMHHSEKHAYREELFENREVYPFYSELTIKPLAAFKSLIRKQSYHVSRFMNQEMMFKIRDLCFIRNFDLILFDGLYAATNGLELRDVHQGQIWLRTHNIEHEIWNHEHNKPNGVMKTWYQKKLFHQLKLHEIQVQDQVDCLLSISKSDSDILERISTTPVKNLPYLPKPKSTVYQSSNNHFFHFGAMNWQPNIQSVDELTNKIFPDISALIANASLQIAGSYLDEMTFPNPQIQKMGFVENLDKFWSNAGIMLAPIRSGSGVRIKILEALSYGIPVITTSLGAQGIEIPNGEGIFICDDAQLFVQKAVELHQNESKRKECSEKALKFMNSASKHLIFQDLFD